MTLTRDCEHAGDWQIAQPQVAVCRRRRRLSLSPLSLCTGATQLYDVLQGYWKYPLYIKIQMRNV